jgi:hypothetical protein
MYECVFLPVIAHGARRSHELDEALVVQPYEVLVKRGAGDAGTEGTTKVRDGHDPEAALALVQALERLAQRRPKGGRIHLRYGGDGSLEASHPEAHRLQLRLQIADAALQQLQGLAEIVLDVFHRTEARSIIPQPGNPRKPPRSAATIKIAQTPQGDCVDDLR